MTDSPAALSVICPHCGAAPGKPCLVGQKGPMPIQLTAPIKGESVQHAARWLTLPLRLPDTQTGRAL